MIQCVFCDGIYKSAQMYRRHLKRHDKSKLDINQFKDEFDKTYDDEISKQFTCDDCGANFTTEHRLTTHACKEQHVNMIKKYLERSITDQNTALKISQFMNEMHESFTNSSKSSKSSKSNNSNNSSKTHVTNINTNSNNTITNNTNSNNVTNNYITVNLYNIDDKIASISMLDKTLINDYNNNVKGYLKKLLKDTKNRDLIKNKHYVNNADTLTLDNLNLSINDNVRNFTKIIMSNLVDIYGQIYFSTHLPQWHIIYVTNKKTDSSFYVREKNKWNLTRNLIKLTDIADNIRDLFVARLRKYGLNEFAQKTLECYAAEKKEITKELFVYSHSQNHIVQSTYYQTQNTNTVTIPVISDNENGMIVTTVNEKAKSSNNNETDEVSELDNDETEEDEENEVIFDEDGLIEEDDTPGEYKDPRVAALRKFEVNNQYYLISSDKIAYYYPEGNPKEYMFNELKLAGERRYNYIIKLS